MHLDPWIRIPNLDPALKDALNYNCNFIDMDLDSLKFVYPHKSIQIQFTLELFSRVVLKN